MLIKYSPEEFKVIEETKVTHNKNDHIILNIEKKDWDTTLFVKELAKRIGISQKKVGYAGLKDKISHSIQNFSIPIVDQDLIEKINIPRTSILSIERGDKLDIGDLVGNEFYIVVRDIAKTEEKLKSKMSKTLTALGKWNGFINYYGYQRFGIQRPVTALVGKHIVKKEYEKAAMVFLAKAYPLDPNKDIRNELTEDLDFKKAYNEFPKSLKYERAMLFQLAYNDSSFEKCFDVLPDRLTKLFIHAYQSKLFNIIVKERINEIPPDVAEVGDMILIDKYEKKASTRVNKSNLKKVNDNLAKDISISAPLLGYKTIFPKSLMGEIAKNVLNSEGIELKDFENKENRKFGSSGSQREILGRYKGLNYKIEDDEVFENLKCNLQFSLKKGEYATVLISQIFDEEVLPYRK